MVEVTYVSSYENFYLVCCGVCKAISLSALLPKIVPLGQFLNGRLQVRHLPEKKAPRLGAFSLVEVTGFEPATSASRTQRSTKLSHTSLFNRRYYIIKHFWLQ